MKTWNKFLAFSIAVMFVATFGLFAGGQQEQAQEGAEGEDLTGTVEVLHWWTSGGEAEALSNIIEALEAKGHTWKDFAVAGGGGDEAMTALRSRAVAGNPPTAAQVKGPQIQAWAKEGFLAQLDPLANEMGWDEMIPNDVANLYKYEGSYVAVPVNVHRMNWMWANPDLFEEAGAEIPTTWDEFEQAADKLQDAGIIPIAWTGGDIWEASVLELVVASKGVDFYKKTMVQGDPEAIDSAKMTDCLETLKMIASYADDGASGREWNESTSMVINDKAAMQFMGDFAKGEFIVADQEPEEDYVARPAPGTQGQFIFNIDSFIFFEQSEAAKRAAQKDLARVILSKEVQRAFNLVKGSIPVRTDMDPEPFDKPAKDSMAAFAEAEKEGTLLPTMAHEMAVGRGVRGAILDTVTTYMNTDMTAEKAATEIATAVSNAK